MLFQLDQIIKIAVLETIHSLEVVLKQPVTSAGPSFSRVFA